MIYDVWYKGTTDRVILDHFLPFDFDPPNNPENRYLKKMRKMPGDIVILHLCTANDNHMMWGSSNRYGARQTEFFVILDHFCPPPIPHPPLTTRKIKILKKWKKHFEILPFYASVPKIMIICFTVREIWSVKNVIVVFHFFAFLPQ